MRGVLVALLVAAGSASIAQGGWIHAKAALAQLLLERAWNETVGGGGPTRPWPWADTRPVGRLEVPAHGVDWVVLAGATGRTLAFGPGHLTGSAPLGAPGNTVIAGHRDTHFAFLRDLADGEEIRVHDERGDVHRYRVVDRQIAHASDASVADPWVSPRLTLVTCFPFDTPVPGGPLRWVVTAVPVGAADWDAELGEEGHAALEVRFPATPR